MRRSSFVRAPKVAMTPVCRCSRACSFQRAGIFSQKICAVSLPSLGRRPGQRRLGLSLGGEAWGETEAQQQPAIGVPWWALMRRYQPPTGTRPARAYGADLEVYAELLPGVAVGET